MLAPNIKRRHRLAKEVKIIHNVVYMPARRLAAVPDDVILSTAIAFLEHFNLYILINNTIIGLK